MPEQEAAVTEGVREGPKLAAHKAVPLKDLLFTPIP
jgi:hypothetical protein